MAGWLNVQRREAKRLCKGICQELHEQLLSGNFHSTLNKTKMIQTESVNVGKGAKINALKMATICLQAGLSVIPARPGTKLPTSGWKLFQTKRMTEAEANRSFTNGGNIAIIGGAISGNLECLDFDKPDLFKPFMDMLEGINQELRTSLNVWQETCSGGYHMIYRCSDLISGNTTLAKGADHETHIETRGEGGYFLVDPSEAIPKQSTTTSALPPKPYTIHGSLDKIPVISPGDRDMLHAIARSFDESIQESRQGGPRGSSASGDRPGDFYN